MEKHLRETSFEVDEYHWWYRARRKIILRELDRLPLDGDLALLDAGCGSGQTLTALSRFGTTNGVEPARDAVSLAQTRATGDVREGYLEAVPWPDESFDVITCLDVIEHTPDDVASLVELRRVAKPGAWLIVTVPAYQWVWSRHDEDNHHHRRYSRRMLRDALKSSGWDDQRLTSFNTLLLPPAAAVRLAQRLSPAPRRDTTSDLEIGPPWLNGLLALVMGLEASWLGSGRTLPAGLSLLAVARRS